MGCFEADPYGSVDAGGRIYRVFRIFQQEIRTTSGLQTAWASGLQSVTATHRRDYIMRESAFGHDSSHAPPVGNKQRNATATTSASLQENNIVTFHFRKFLDRYFYFGMSLLVAAVVVFGFSHTIEGNLLHADIPRPSILYIHAIVFSGWVVLFIVQSALVRMSKVTVHRRLGIYGALHGGILPFIGVTTALVMQHFHDVHHDDASSAALSLPFNDMLTFSIVFGLAIRWRRRPEFHRRLMLMATCCLMGAAFARFPESMVPANAFYVGVDVLILLGVLRDLVIMRRVHVVYRYGLPCMMVSQALAQYLMLATPSLWLEITQRIVQWTV
jgi:hypothetical protein